MIAGMVPRYRRDHFDISQRGKVADTFKHKRAVQWLGGVREHDREYEDTQPPRRTRNQQVRSQRHSARQFSHCVISMTLMHPNDNHAEIEILEYFGLSAIG